MDAVKAAAEREKQQKLAAAQQAATASSIAHWLGDDSDDADASAGGRAAPSGRDFFATGGKVPTGNDPSGFVPFQQRKAEGLNRKKMGAQVLRTLESVYARSTYPSGATIKSLHDLHRLPRDAVLDWFTARRELDGLPAAGRPKRGKKPVEEEWRFVRNGVPGPTAEEDHADLMQMLGRGDEEAEELAVRRVLTCLSHYLMGASCFACPKRDHASPHTSTAFLILILFVFLLFLFFAGVSCPRLSSLHVRSCSIR